jgi:hypothetical protein
MKYMVKNSQYLSKISDYLDLVNAIKTLPKKDTWTFYDVEADVLYINFHQPALTADDSELTEDGILSTSTKLFTQGDSCTVRLLGLSNG